MKKIIIVSNLNYFYDKKNILKNISFSIDNSSFFVIIGPNGSGKTTLVRLLAGLEKIIDGDIIIMGKSLRNYTSKQLSQILAYVPQNIPINFPFTVSEIVYMGRTPYLGVLGFTSSIDNEIVMNSMKFTGIEHLADCMVYKLSVGERQRVFIAKAICQEPNIIIMDEPTAALDIANQVKIMDLMEKMIKIRNITVIMVSHDINLASMYCDKLLLIRSGFVVGNGSPMELLKIAVLEEVYGCYMFVDRNPFDKDIPRVTTIPKRYCKNL